MINVVEIINHPQNHHFYRWYKQFPCLGGLWHCFNHIRWFWYVGCRFNSGPKKPEEPQVWPHWLGNYGTEWAQSSWFIKVCGFKSDILGCAHLLVLAGARGKLAGHLETVAPKLSGNVSDPGWSLSISISESQPEISVFSLKDQLDTVV